MTCAAAACSRCGQAVGRRSRPLRRETLALLQVKLDARVEVALGGLLWNVVQSNRPRDCPNLDCRNEVSYEQYVANMTSENPARCSRDTAEIEPRCDEREPGAPSGGAAARPGLSSRARPQVGP